MPVASARVTSSDGAYPSGPSAESYSCVLLRNVLVCEGTLRAYGCNVDAVQREGEGGSVLLQGAMQLLPNIRFPNFSLHMRVYRYSW